MFHHNQKAITISRRTITKLAYGRLHRALIRPRCVCLPRLSRWNFSEQDVQIHVVRRVLYDSERRACLSDDWIPRRDFGGVAGESLDACDYESNES
jgi:hypothetical protein